MIINLDTEEYGRPQLLYEALWPAIQKIENHLIFSSSPLGDRMLSEAVRSDEDIEIGCLDNKIIL